MDERERSLERPGSRERRRPGSTSWEGRRLPQERRVPPPEEEVVYIEVDGRRQRRPGRAHIYVDHDLQFSTTSSASEDFLGAPPQERYAHSEPTRSRERESEFLAPGQFFPERPSSARGGSPAHHPPQRRESRRYQVYSNPGHATPMYEYRERFRPPRRLSPTFRAEYDRDERRPRSRERNSHGRWPPVPPIWIQEPSMSYSEYDDEVEWRRAGSNSHVNRHPPPPPPPLVRRRLYHQTERFPSPLRDYLRPMTQDPLTMDGAARTMREFDADPHFLAETTGRFVRCLVSHSEDDATVGSDDDAHPEDHGAETLREEEGEDSEDDDDPRYSSRSRNRSSRRQRKDRSRLSGIFDRFRGGQDDDGSDEPPPREPPPRGPPPRGPWLGGPGYGGSDAFMRWGGFDRYKLPAYTDLVDDRNKAMVSMFNEIELGLPTPVGSVSLKGFVGTVLRLLKPQDWAAYYRASGERELFLPGPVSRNPSPDELRALENRLLGVSQFLGSSSSMTCVTYNKSDYGTLTTFDIDYVEFEGGTFVRSIRPVAAMPYVPKKLLKRLVKSAPPHSGRVTVNIKSRATSPGGRFRWRGVSGLPKIRYRTHVRRAVLPPRFVESLAVDKRWLPLSHGAPRNLVDATIPQMIAWLHAKSAVLRNIDLDGGAFLNGAGDGSKPVIRWKSGPGADDHIGADPCIVVLFPDDAVWATERLYWTGG